MTSRQWRDFKGDEQHRNHHLPDAIADGRAGSVPKLGRPALANVCFVVFGLALGPLVQTDVATMIKQAGEVGFLLVLFEVGLEIDLPKLRELLPSLRFAVLWSLVQYPLILALAAFRVESVGRVAGGVGADELLDEHGVFRLETLSGTDGTRRGNSCCKS